MSTLGRDLAVALRALRSNLGPTVVAVVSFALGIGAATTIFSAIDVFMIRPVSFERGDDLVLLLTLNAQRGGRPSRSSMPDIRDWQAQSKTLDIAPYQSAGFNVSGGDLPERMDAFAVGVNFFSLLRVRPAEGRDFLPEDGRPGGAPVVILTDRGARRRYGGEPAAAVGKGLSLDGVPYTVVGVMPPGFRFGEGFVDAFLPIVVSGEEARGARVFYPLGRVREGRSLAEARAEMEGIARRLSAAHPENAGNGSRIIRMQEYWHDEEFRQASLICGAAALFVLLIACGNVANLLLIRALGRGREIALEGALGASRGRIVGRQLSESLLLALAGGFFGVLLAVAGVRGFASLLDPGHPDIEQLRIGLRPLLFTLVVVAVAALAAGLVPALRSSRPNLAQALREGGRTGTAGKGGRLRKALATAEVCLALVLLVGAGLLMRSYLRLAGTETGFDPKGVLTFQITLPEARYGDDNQVRIFERQLLERLAAMPGVEAVGATSHVPTRGSDNTGYGIPGQDLGAPDQAPTAALKHVAPGYFTVLRMRMAAGREIGWNDTADSPPVVVVNESFATRHWPGQGGSHENAVGQRVELDGVLHEVVGVARDVRDFGPENAAQPTLLKAVFQAAPRNLTLVLRAAGDPASLVNPVRREVARLDSAQAIHEVLTMDHVLAGWLGGQRAMMQILVVVSAIALILAVIGVYGVMAYSVAQRRREIGIRMAIGAERRSVLSLVMGEGARLTGLGVGLGLVLAFVATRLLAFFLYGVGPFDALTFFGVALLLLAVGLAATYLPALRATKVDPIRVLREE